MSLAGCFTMGQTDNHVMLLSLSIDGSKQLRSPNQSAEGGTVISRQCL